MKSHLEELICGAYGETVEDLLKDNPRYGALENNRRKALGQYLQQSLQQRLERTVKTACRENIGPNMIAVRHRIHDMWREAAHVWLTEIEEMPINEILTHEDPTIRKFGRIFRRLFNAEHAQ